MNRAAWRHDLSPIRGELVTVREVMPTDVATLFELLTDPAVCNHISSPPPTIEAFAGFITWARSQREQGKVICFGIVPHGVACAVGIIQIRALDAACVIAEWGFALGAAFW